MQRVIYECDHCHKECPRKGKHISLRLSVNSGVAVSPNTDQNGSTHWKVMPDLNGRFVHFCDEKHLAAYFKAFIDDKKIR